MTRNNSVTPAKRCATNILTPSPRQASNNDTSTANIDRPTRLTRRSAAASKPTAKLKVPRSFFTSRNVDRTCYHFGLDPNVGEHKRVMCRTCVDIWNRRREGTTIGTIKERERSARDMCCQPWYIDNNSHVQDPIRKAHYDFLALFDGAPAEEQDDADNNNDPAQARKRQKTTRANSEQHGDAQHGKQNDNNMEDTKPITVVTRSLTDNDGVIMKDAVEFIEQELKYRLEKNGKSLQTHEMKLCGMLLQMMFKDDINRERNTAAASQTVDKYTINIDFAAVKSIKLIYSDASKSFEGLAFEDEAGRRRDSLFKKAVLCKNKDTASIVMRKIVIFGILSADLDFLYTLFGHQGCSALLHCLFCLISKRDTTRVFTDPSFCSTIKERTIEDLKSCAQMFKEQYEVELNLAQKAKTGSRKNVTQKVSCSITKPPLLDVPLECITRSSMHIILGISKAFFDMIISGYECILEMEISKDAGGGDITDATISKHIRIALRKVVRYRRFLKEQVSTDLYKALIAMDSSYSEIISKIDDIEERLDEDFGLTSDMQQELEQQLDALNNQKSNTEEAAKQVVGNGDYAMLLLEQITIAKQTQDELETVQKHHEGFVEQTVTGVCKKNGVDTQPYFNGSIVGNQCAKLAERGESILSGCFEELESHVNDDQHRSYLEAFTQKMKEILALWFRILRVMKSVDKQSDYVIQQFKTNVDALRDLICNLIEGDIIPGWKKKQKLPSSLKSHLLFSPHVYDQLKLWGTLGAFDEQNIESAHAVWNALLRRYGATRGKRLKEVVLNEFLFQTSSEINIRVGRIKSKLKRKNTPSAPRQTAVVSNVDSDDVDDVEQVCESEDMREIHTKINEEIAFHPQLEIDEEVANDEEDQTDSNACSDNRIAAKDTEVVVCEHCSKVFLRLALQIHHKESHAKNKFAKR